MKISLFFRQALAKCPAEKRGLGSQRDSRSLPQQAQIARRGFRSRDRCYIFDWRQRQSILRQVRSFPAVLGLGLAVLAAAQGQTAKKQTAAPTGFRIAGVVVNAETGEPVVRALVAALDIADSHTVASAETDGEGRFTLAGLAAAKYQLTASRRSYRTAFYDEHEEYSSAIVTGPDQDTIHLHFRLSPASEIYGMVTADGGDAVEGGQVTLFERKRDHARSGGPAERVLQAGTTTTDDLGMYEFTGLEPGDYYMAVVAEPWYAVHRDQRKSQMQNNALDVTYPLTFFDSTTEEGAATRIAVGRGGREEVNINLHATPAIRLAVSSGGLQGGMKTITVATMAFGTEIASRNVFAFAKENSQSMEIVVMAPGRYAITTGTPARTVELDTNSSGEVDLTQATALAVLSGTVTSASGTLPAELTLGLSRLNAAGGEQTLHAPVHNGQFHFIDVPSGEWELTAQSGEAVAPVVAVTVDGKNHAGGALTVGSRPLVIRATVAVGGTRIEGFACKDGRSRAGMGVMVLLVPRAPGAMHALARRDQSDSDGSFALRDVPPGQYTVVAIENGWEMDWGLKGALDRYLPGGVSVRVTGATGKLVRLEKPVTVQPR